MREEHPINAILDSFIGITYTNVLLVDRGIIASILYTFLLTGNYDHITYHVVRDIRKELHLCTIEQQPYTLNGITYLTYENISYKPSSLVNNITHLLPTIKKKFRRYHRTELVEPFNIDNSQEIMSFYSHDIYVVKNYDELVNHLTFSELAVVEYDKFFYYTSRLKGDLNTLHVIKVEPLKVEIAGDIIYTVTYWDQGSLEDLKVNGIIVCRDQLCTILNAMSVRGTAAALDKSIPTVNLSGYSKSDARLSERVFEEIYDEIKEPFGDFYACTSLRTYYTKDCFDNLISVRYDFINAFTDYVFSWHERGQIWRR